MVDIDFVAQLVDSMEAAVLKLEKAAAGQETDEVNKLRTFIFDLHRQMNGVLGSENV